VIGVATAARDHRTALLLLLLLLLCALSHTKFRRKIELRGKSGQAAMQL
jgi:hypothetical protein